MGAILVNLIIFVYPIIASIYLPPLPYSQIFSLSLLFLLLFFVTISICHQPYRFYNEANFLLSSIESERGWTMSRQQVDCL